MSQLEPELGYKRKTDQIIESLHEQYDPDHIYALVSGGHDSDTALHVSHLHPDLDISGVVHVNTGIGVPETREFVMQRCADLGHKYIELTDYDDAARKQHTDGFSTHRRISSDHPFPHLETEYIGVRPPKEQYEALITKYGFPGPPVHHKMYINLKEKPLQKFVSEHDGTVVFLSGVRQAESHNRMENIDSEGIQEKIGAVWVAPIMAWSDAHLNDYRDEHDLPENPVVEKLHMSAECLCGAFADRRELEMLKIFYPDVARYIETLEQTVLSEVEAGNVPEEYALWAHGGLSDSERQVRTDSQQTSFTLCSDCEQQCSQPYSRDGNSLSITEALLKHDHVNDSTPQYYCPDCHTVFDDALAHREEVHPFGSDGVTWDVRQIDLLESSRRDATITEPDAATQCTVEHDWELTVDGALHCADCGSYNLSDGEVSLSTLVASSTIGDPSPSPATNTTETDDNYTLSQFAH